jgi:hypothetical protein
MGRREKKAGDEISGVSPNLVSKKCFLKKEVGVEKK